MHALLLWVAKDIKRPNIAYLQNTDDRLLGNSHFDLELETIAWPSCVFLSSWADHHEQVDRRPKREVTDKGQRQNLENRKLLYLGIRWVRYLCKNGLIMKKVS